MQAVLLMQQLALIDVQAQTVRWARECAAAEDGDTDRLIEIVTRVAKFAYQDARRQNGMPPDPDLDRDEGGDAPGSPLKGGTE